MRAKVPDRKRDGRPGPPKGYPKDPRLYADPNNWKYPVHTPWHARAARRYFDEMSNRMKYTEEERVYIDQEIDEALRKFGELPAPETPTMTSNAKNISRMSVREILGVVVGKTRLPRAEDLARSEVAIREVGLRRVKAKMRQYTVEVDSGRKSIIHDCPDWQKRMESKLFCKHVGALFLKLDESKARELLHSILREQAEWAYSTA